MLLGIWRSHGRPLAEPLQSQLSALTRQPGATRVECANATLASWFPAHIEATEQGWTGWGSGPSSVSSSAQPVIQLSAKALTLTGPALPQYPLYYVRGPNDEYLIACSRLEPLARFFPRASLSRLRLVSTIRLSAVDPDRRGTIYAGIQRLLPSEVISAASSGVRTARTLPRIGRTYRRERPEELAAELYRQLDEAVGRAVGSCRRIAVLVSGGLDSSGLLTLAAKRCADSSGRELYPISLQFTGPGADGPYFDALVEAFHLSPTRLSAADGGKWFRESLCADGQPTRSAAASFDLLFYSTIASLQADVGLMGSTGDFICGGPLPFGQLVRRGRILDAIEGALRIRVPWTMTPWDRLRTYLVRPFLPNAVLRARQRFGHRQPWMTAAFVDALERCYDASERAARTAPDTPDEWMESLCEGDDCVLPDYADMGGQMRAVTDASPVDVFMDFDFVRFMLEIDPALLSHGDEYRGLYRLAMKGALPEVVRTRQDKASFEPAIGAAAMASGAVDLLEDLSSLDALATRGLVDPAGFRPLFDRWLGAARQGERPTRVAGDECCQQVWQLLSVETFLREHGHGRDLA